MKMSLGEVIITTVQDYARTSNVKATHESLNAIAPNYLQATL